MQFQNRLYHPFSIFQSWNDIKISFPTLLNSIQIWLDWIKFEEKFGNIMEVPNIVCRNKLIPILYFYIMKYNMNMERCVYIITLLHGSCIMMVYKTNKLELLKIQKFNVIFLASYNFFINQFSPKTRIVYFIFLKRKYL